MDRLVEHLAVFGAEKLADDNAGAGGEAGEEADQHVDDRGDRPDGGEGFGRDKVADDD